MPLSLFSCCWWHLLISGYQRIFGYPRISLYHGISGYHGISLHILTSLDIVGCLYILGYILTSLDILGYLYIISWGILIYPDILGYPRISGFQEISEDIGGCCIGTGDHEQRSGFLLLWGLAMATKSYKIHPIIRKEYDLMTAQKILWQKIRRMILRSRLTLLEIGLFISRPNCKSFNHYWIHTPLHI